MTPQFICLNSWESPDNFSFRWVENVWWQKIKPLFLSWYNKTILITTPKGNNTFCFPFFSWRLPLCAYWLQCRKQTTSQGLSNDRRLGHHYQWHTNLALCRGEIGTRFQYFFLPNSWERQDVHRFDGKQFTMALSVHCYKCLCILPWLETRLHSGFGKSYCPCLILLRIPGEMAAPWLL